MIEEIIRFICAKMCGAEYVEVATMLYVMPGKREVKVAVPPSISKYLNDEDPKKKVEFTEHIIRLEHRIILDDKRDYRFGYSAVANVIAYGKVAP